MGGFWKRILQKIPRTQSVKQESAALLSVVFGVHRVLQLQRLACAKQGTRKRARMYSSFVCMCSTTSTKKRRGAMPFRFKWMTKGRAVRSENPPKAVELLRVAKHAVAAGEAFALVGGRSKMDGSWWQRVSRPYTRCCRLCCWTSTTTTAASSSKEEGRKKERRPVQTMRPTLQGPEHGGNMHENTERRHLSIDPPVYRWRASCTSGPPWRRQQRRQWQRGQRMGNVWTDPVSVSASSVAALGERDVFLDSKAPGGAERQRQRPARGRTGGPVHCGGRTLRDRRIGERGTKQQ